MAESASGGMPLVSVVTVCLNAERYLAETMSSVLEQTYPHIEYIVMDGGSTDGTLEIIRSFEPRFEGRLRWVSEPDSGIYDAMNKGIALCTGEVIGLLNSDDRYLPDAIARIVEAARSAPGAGLVYGDVHVIDEDGVPLSTEIAEDLKPGDRPDWMPMCHQSLFVARGVYDAMGAYDVTYRILADYEFVLRCLSAGIVPLHVPTAVCEFRVGGLCNTATLESNRERERIRVLYGANAIRERMRRVVHGVNNRGYALMKRVKIQSLAEWRVRSLHR